jgi:hypothetical protein
MGSPGQTSVQITFKVNTTLRDKIEKERRLSGGTLAEFMNDAVKFYINHLEEKRYNEATFEKYIQLLSEKNDSTSMEPDVTANYKIKRKRRNNRPIEKNPAFRR